MVSASGAVISGFSSKFLPFKLKRLRVIIDNLNPVIPLEPRFDSLSKFK